MESGSARLSPNPSHPQPIQRIIQTLERLDHAVLDVAGVTWRDLHHGLRCKVRLSYPKTLSGSICREIHPRRGLLLQHLAHRKECTHETRPARDWYRMARTESADA